MANEHEEDGVQLPPAFLRFQAQLKNDRKQLLRDKAYGQSPDQLRAFIAQFMFTRLDEFVQLMGLALTDTYGLAVSSESQIQRMRAVYGKALKRLGADVEDEDGELPGVSPEVMDEFQQYFYALGTLLQKKLPEDAEVQAAFNKCAEALGDMTAELLHGGGDEGEDDDEDDDEDEDEDEDDDDEDGDEGVDDAAPEASKAADGKKPEVKPEAAKPEAKPAGEV